MITERVIVRIPLDCGTKIIEKLCVEELVTETKDQIKDQILRVINIEGGAENADKFYNEYKKILINLDKFEAKPWVKEYLKSFGFKKMRRSKYAVCTFGGPV